MIRVEGSMVGWNDAIIEEFRSNEGRVNGRFQGMTLLLLHHRGARTGTERVNPLAYRDLGGDSVAVFGSKGGAPTNPDWYHNVQANPDVRVEIGTETLAARARVAEGEERERIWEAQKRDIPGFAEYEKRSPRQIPVVILELSRDQTAMARVSARVAAPAPARPGARRRWRRGRPERRMPSRPRC